MIYVRIHHTDKGMMVAMCDEELIGKVFTEGAKEINLKDYADFYKGELVDEEKALSMIDERSLYSANVVGKRAVKQIIKKGLAKQAQVAKISGVQVVQVYMID